MTITVKEAIATIRRYTNEERLKINKLVKDDRSYLPQAREVDRVLDNIERRCRIIESKDKE